MNTQKRSLQFIDEVPERTIVEYLRQHPEFFTYHEELLAKMEIPHTRGAAISLVERQLTVLREENRRLQHKLESIIAIAQKNDQLNQRVQHLFLTLLSAKDIDEFFNALYETLQHEFNTDTVVIRVFELPPPSLAGRQEFVEYDAQVFALFETLLETNKPLCGRLSETQMHYLFRASKVASAVLVPLGAPRPCGLLALGSQDVGRFHAGMATDLLKYMGESVGQLLRLWLRY
jgi:hypothetical protein